jgi:hypothetical protein
MTKAGSISSLMLRIVQKGIKRLYARGHQYDIQYIQSHGYFLRRLVKHGVVAEQLSIEQFIVPLHETLKPTRSC